MIAPKWADGEPTESGYYFVQYMTTQHHAPFNSPKTRIMVTMARLDIFFGHRTVARLYCGSGMDINVGAVVRWSERVPEPEPEQ